MTADPAKLGSKVTAAEKEVRRKIRRIKKHVDDWVAMVPKQERTANKVYTYDLDEQLYRQITTDIERALREEWLAGGETELWLLREYVQPAYNQGVAQALAALKAQSAVLRLQGPSIDQLAYDPAYLKRIGLVRARVFEEMQGFADATRKDLAETLARSMGAGHGARRVRDDIIRRIGVSESRAMRIARTEIATAHKQATLDETDDAAERYDLKTMMMQLSAFAATSRQSHMDMHGGLFTTDEVRQWLARDANGINCYLPGTRVQGRFSAGVKSLYRGDVIEIVTACGRNITVTPNHPILTESGMVAAGDIKEGFNLVAYGGEVKDTIRVGNLNDEHIVSSVEEIFASLSEVGHSITTGVHAVDFHGDGRFMDKDISVVFLERELTRTGDAALDQLLDDIGLEHSSSQTISSERNRSFVKRLFGVRLPAPPAMSVRSKLHALFGGPLARKEVLGFGHVSRLYARLFTPSCDSAARSSVQGGDAFDAKTVSKKIYEFARRCIRRARSGFNGKLFARSINNGCRSSEYGGGDAHGCASADNRPELIRADDNLLRARFAQVAHVHVHHYEGYVYDLQERSGVMLAEGVITSNCLCSFVPVLVDSQGKPLSDTITRRAQQIRQRMENAANPCKHKHCC